MKMPSRPDEKNKVSLDTPSNITVGLLPSAGGGVGPLAATGQASRLINGYFKRYAQAFEQIFYFSYLAERLENFTDDTAILTKLKLIPRNSRLPYRLGAFILPWQQRGYFRQCDLFRVFQATGAAPALVAKWLYDIPYVTTYGYDYAGLARTEGRPLAYLYLRALEGVILRNAAGVIVTTQELAAQVSRYVAPGNIHLIPNGVDTDLFTPAPPPINDPPVILFVGRFEKQKNLPTLLTAVAQLQSHRPVRLKLIGQGSLANTLKIQAADLKLAVEFAEVVPHEHLPAAINAADVFVSPSLLEGHPKLLIEAMSCAKPCVVSNCQGNRNVIEDGVHGLLFEPFDITGFVNQMERVLHDKALRLQVGQAARKRVLNEWDFSRLVEREVKLLKSLVSS